MSAIFSALQGSNTYSALDMVQSFWQMRIDDQSAPATAFQVPPMDRYEFVRAPMGMQSSSSWMERNVRRVLSGFDTIYAVHYLDDILCFSGDSDDPSDERSRIARHLDVTEKVLNRLWSFGVTLGVRKCTWAQPSADFLGHRVNADGIQPLPRLCQGIADLAEPRSTPLASILHHHTLPSNEEIRAAQKASPSSSAIIAALCGTASPPTKFTSMCRASVLERT